VIIIAIGANLPGLGGEAPLATCLAAVEALRSLPGLRLQAVSRWYATRPIPVSDQPDYINGVVRLVGETDPSWLLATLHRIEEQGGRVRAGINAPRTLDLDIIALNGLIRNAPDPVLPHPRAHLREFVLRPLLDVAPEWQHPVLGQGAAELLAGLASQGVRLIEAPE
jgi:2-amino-4-hydroxy-6-hydroxymethyldihydropteridine diphosphokinase